MTKIAIDCTHLVAGRVGGLESYLLNLLEGLAEIRPAEVDFTLFVRRDQLQSFAGLAGSFRIRPVVLRGKIQRSLWQNLVLPLRSREFSVMLFPANVKPFLLACPSVTVLHDLQFLHFAEFWPWHVKLHHRIFLARSVRSSSVLVTISRTIAEEASRAFGRRNAVTIYNPIRLARDAAGARAAAAVPEPFFLVPSTILPHKNLPALLEAIAGLEDELPSLPHFVFIGAYAREEFPGPGRCSKALVLGYVERERRDALFRDCLGLVLPSLYEGFGMPYVEAVLAGKPVIASDIGIAREMLEDAACYIRQPHGAAEIQAAIREFLERPATPPSGESARRLLQVTTPSTVARRYLDVLLSACSTRPIEPQAR